MRDGITPTGPVTDATDARYCLRRAMIYLGEIHFAQREGSYADFRSAYAVLDSRFTQLCQETL